MVEKKCLSVNPAEIQWIIITDNLRDLIDVILCILKQCFGIIYSFLQNKLFWRDSGI